MKLQIQTNQSIYFSRLIIDINMWLELTEDIRIMKAYISENNTDFKLYIKKAEKLKKLHFLDSEENELEYNSLILSRIWDSFILYLNNLRIGSGKVENDIGERIEYAAIKKELNDLEICPLHQPEWDELKKIGEFRNRYAHRHKIRYIMKALETRKAKDIQFKKPTLKNINEAAQSIRNFARAIDKEFLKNYPAIPQNF